MQQLATENLLKGWQSFLACAKKQSTAVAFDNWIAPIVAKEEEGQLILQIPNVFVKDYLLENFKAELCAFLPVDATGSPIINFNIQTTKKKSPPPAVVKVDFNQSIKFNPNYCFKTFIEGPSNQFVKSAALGVAARPGKSYNPLFIHGGVGLGKTHMLHSIGQYIREQHPHLRIQCITTEAFINDLVDHLRAKSTDKLKHYYRSQVDVLLVDDIQFLQNRLNFEEEFCHTFETLINNHKQIVITSDKPPSDLKLSERITARMEWGLVTHIGTPDLETRAAILQHKAELKGLTIPPTVAFFLAERITQNVRQLEGAINRLSAHCRLLDIPITETLAEELLKEMLHRQTSQKLTVEQILGSVATVFQVRVADLKGASRKKEVALPRQIAMYLAKEKIDDPLSSLASAFGRTHSTLLHAHKAIADKLTEDDTLRRHLSMIERSLR
ncbi:MAG: chromosomal replication initiator protein DnaA [Chlamydiia bacterium]|nr:chromosomal replication initiator protein DnaA [Chlamydiia bacterium]